MIDVGHGIPDIELLDTDMKPVRLSRLRGKITVIAFFPGAFTGVCTKEMCTFRDNMAKLNALNAEVVGISVDGPFANKAFKEQNRINFRLLSDYSRTAVKEFGIELKDFAGMKGYTASKRAIFIVGKDMKVQYRWVSDDPTVEPDYSIIMEEANRLTN
jgi:peroxiredoxin